MRNRNRFRTVLAALVLAAAAACDLGRYELVAKRAAEDFHDRWSKSQFGAIYADTDFGFRHDETASRFIARMKAQHDSLGGIVKTQLAGAAAEADDKGGVVVKQEFRTEFERGTAVEQLSWRVKREGKEAHLLSYRLR